MPIKNKFLIAFIGPVGSGKTYVARVLARKLAAVHIRTDDIRVLLRRRGKSYSRSPEIAKRMTEDALHKGKSAVLDFDAVRYRRRSELKKLARSFGVKAAFIQVKTPEKIILSRLRRHRYTKKDLFRSAGEAVRVYYIRRKFHQKPLRPKPDFVINNARPLGPQLQKVIQKLRNFPTGL